MDNAKIRFSRHAIDQMNERGIGMAEVLHVIMSPEVTYATKTGKIRFESVAVGLNVIMAQDAPVVVTVHRKGEK